MKYRQLTTEELTVLEKDLINFLIVNGIDGDEWKKINEQDPEKAQKLVEIFSDLVLETTYRKLNFVEFRSPTTCIVFKMNADSCDFITLQLKDNTIGDLSTPESIHDTLVNHTNNITYSKNSRINTKPREEEIHTLITQGCVPSIADFWISLEKAIEIK